MADTAAEHLATKPSRAAAGPSLGLPPGWWPVAHGEEIGRHPGAFRLGSRDLAVYRDLQGVVRAVDDSCPHRRLPLSMGRITEDGSLQCAYHGWCFDGATGRCTSIPNLSESEKVPAGIKVAAFTTAENVADLLGFGLRTPVLAPAVGPPTGEEPEEGTTMFDADVADGLVLVWTGEQAPDAVPASRTAAGSDGAAFTGTVEVRAPHRAVADALMLNAGAALGLGVLLGSGDELCDPDVAVRGTGVVARRERVAFALPRMSTYGPLNDRVVAAVTTVDATTGLTRIKVAADGRRPAYRVVVGLTPIGPYRTVVRWRGTAEGPGAAAWAVGARATSAARIRARRAAGSVESLVDTVETAAGGTDPAVRALRALRAEQDGTATTTDGGTS
jgi:nitrite reductase/ring-hydroxylating ferredoxin subunit